MYICTRFSLIKEKKRVQFQHFARDGPKVSLGSLWRLPLDPQLNKGPLRDEAHAGLLLLLSRELGARLHEFILQRSEHGWQVRRDRNFFVVVFQVFSSRKPSISLGKINKANDDTGIWILGETVARGEDRGLGIVDLQNRLGGTQIQVLAQIWSEDNYEEIYSIVDNLIIKFCYTPGDAAAVSTLNDKPGNHYVIICAVSFLSWWGAT